ncbi:hypothetical protein NGTWS0302_16930 [Mycolicibacterium cyprinidarum]|uniref:DNA-binding phage zinc finger domain-containing protein n=1 Tax=Mycolicibacterium cyprinidarum TaxID=2860311 RepID=A0ABQ4VCC0_9MYCO|nr:hypothetical protein NGTWS1702_24620 [Mycolicibacterium sp. NGTWSNA01]GJF18565.1 hypothetical protein NGTWS0302_16930 [Mycolicibacterium sp. NGTWS0302]
MNRNDVIDVLSAVAANDRRTVGEADVAVWLGVIGDLPVDFALKAVVQHIRECPGVWLEPGHVYQIARDMMRDEREREPDAHREARQAALDAKAAPDPTPRPFVGPVKHHRPQCNWMNVRCPHCNAPPLNHCVVPGTTRRPHGGTHPARLEVAMNRPSAEHSPQRKAQIP